MAPESPCDTPSKSPKFYEPREVTLVYPTCFHSDSKMVCTRTHLSNLLLPFPRPVNQVILFSPVSISRQGAIEAIREGVVKDPIPW